MLAQQDEKLATLAICKIALRKVDMKSSCVRKKFID